MKLYMRIILAFAAFLAAHILLNIGYAYIERRLPGGFAALVGMVAFFIVFFVTRKKTS